MAHVCEVCNKGELSGNNVSHSHLKTKRSWKPNIQRVRAVVDGEVKRINVCTRCLRSGKVERALRPIVPPEASSDFCHRLVLHGRAVCTARKPYCDTCCLAEICKTAQEQS